MSHVVGSISRYTLMTGHKLVGWLYGYAGYIGGIYGFSLSIFMRAELGSPGLGVTRKVKETFLYNSFITGHGLSMLFLFVMPIAIGGYGNYLLPMMIGSSELIMPRLNGTSFWMLGGAVVTLLLCAVLMERPACCGWTLYPPLSTRDADSGSVATDLSLFSVHLLGLSSGLGAMNFLATLKHCRHSGLTILATSMLPLGIGVTSILLVGALPVLGVGVTGLLLDRNVSTCMYDGVLGGDPVLYQHLFWFFGHPEVYIIILPIFGVVSSVICALTHRDLFGKEGMVFCMASIGIVGFCVWAHHMFTAGLDVDSRAYFSAATGIVAIPTSVKVFSYLASLAGGRMARGSSAVMAVFSFLSCFTVGGFTGLILSSASLDVMLHDTYFVVGHFHTVLSLGAVFGILVGHYSFLSMWTAVSVSEGEGIYQVVALLLGAILIFGPMHSLGLMGMSRRVPEYCDVFWEYMHVGTTGTLELLLSVSILTRCSYMALTTPVHAGLR